METNQERIVILTNNRFEDLKDVFKVLSKNNKGKITQTYYACATNFQLNPIENIDPKLIQKFNILQQKCKMDGYTTVIYSFNITIPAEDINNYKPVGV